MVTGLASGGPEVPYPYSAVNFPAVGNGCLVPSRDGEGKAAWEETGTSVTKSWLLEKFGFFYLKRSLPIHFFFYSLFHFLHFCNRL